MVESILTMFHLRRVQFQAYVKEAKGRSVSTDAINDAIEPSGIAAVRERSTMILLDKQTKIGRNPELVDVVLHSVVHSNMISRDHSEIIGETDSKGQFVRYYISDRSLNGTYVNDTRVKENVLLSEGDLIKFGHVNGAAIKAGEHAPQDKAEFIFRFERALPKFAYFGYSPKGVRVHPHQNEQHPQQQRRAYMQINSDRILPTEVYASLAPGGGASAAAVGGGVSTGPTVPRPVPAGACSAAVTIRGGGIAAAATTTGCTSSGGTAAPSCAVAPSFPLLQPSFSLASSSTATSTAATVIPSCSSATPSTNNNGSVQIAQLAAAAAATTLANTVAAAASASNSAAQQQQQQQQQRNPSNGGTADATTNSAAAAVAASSTLNALNQLGLASATEEQVAAVNAHLRQLMASHDAMSAMERLTAQQQWNNSLFKLSSLQQQNPLVYGHAFPAAAAAAAALFTGCIDLNSAAAAGNQNAAAAQYAASLWPNIRALQPSVSQAADWTQQQKAAALAQQLHLRLPGLYQQQQQQAAVAACVVQPRGSSVSMPNVASSLFGTPSAFSLPGTQLHNTTNTPVTLPSSSSAGLLVAAQQQCVSTSSSSSSAAYASCTSSAPSAVGIAQMRPLGESPISSLSRGGSVSLPLHQPQGTSVMDQQQQNAAAALAARLAAAQQLAKELEADQQAKSSNNSVPGWCSSTAGTSVPVTKVSPVVGGGSSNGIADAGTVGGTTPLQRIPGIASALAAAVVAAQQQQHQQNVPPWPSGTPPNNVSHPSLDTPPIRQPLAQRIFSPAVSNSSNLSLSSGSSKSSSGVSSAPSSGLLQSPSYGGTTATTGLNNSDVGKEFRDSFSSLLTTNSLTTSAFSSPQTAGNTTNLNTLTTAMFAAEREKVANNTTRRQGTPAKASTTTEEMGKKTTDFGVQKTEEGEQKETPTQKGLSNDATIEHTTTTALNAAFFPFDHEKSQMEQLAISKPTNFLGDDHEDAKKTTDGVTLCEEKREQMECDSSVPSPPPIKEQGEKLLKRTDQEKRGDDCGRAQEERVDALAVKPSSHRKRLSSAGSPLSPADSFGAGRDEKMDRDKDGDTKPRPIKHARKSNEVARLLNDLTAGNCTGNKGAHGNRENLSKKNGGKCFELDNWRELDTAKGDKKEKKTSDSGTDKHHEQKYLEQTNQFIQRNQSEPHFDAGLLMDEGKKMGCSLGNSRKTNEKFLIVEGVADMKSGSWQYMAERSQKLAAQSANFSGGRCDSVESPSMAKGGRMGVEKTSQKQMTSQFVKAERKRPLRLEERKRAEMERKRAHKMMRQISDESSDEEHNGVAEGSTNGRPGEEAHMACSTKASSNDSRSSGVQKQLHQQRHTDNTKKKQIDSPQLSTDDEGDGEDNRKSTELTSSDSDHHHLQRHYRRHSNNRRGKESDKNAKMEENSGQTQGMTNGDGSVAKRKLLSSAPGTKKAMTQMNNLTTAKLVNGGPRSDDGTPKRGPKGRVEEKAKSLHCSKKLTSNTHSALMTSGPLKKKTVGRKMGNGRGRPAGNAQKAEDGSSNNGDSSDDDSSIDQPVHLLNESERIKLNGDQSAMGKGNGRKGRHKGCRRDDSSPDLATTTVAEDWTGGSGDPELCAHRKCQRPLHMSINWVQCDDCDQWFHSTCVFGTNTTPEDDADFHCGCGINGGKVSAETNIAKGKSISTASLSSSA